MNNLMSKKKKYRFQVELRVEELQHVPFLCQELYVKCRLLNGGFTHHSQSLTVENHSVRWDETFKFCSKMTAKASTGELDSCICRVSVRQEMKGGRSFQKLGYADVNLAQFAGSGGTNCYLLEAYDSKHRLHNSTLKVTVDMTLLSGDPCFKAQPWPSQPPIIDGQTENRIKPELASGSVGSIPSLGYNSLDKKTKAADDLELKNDDQVGHSRNSSNTSGSGYASNASHSDRSGHARSGSQGSGVTGSEGGSLERPLGSSSNRTKPSMHSDSSKDPRLVSTREDPHDIVNQIFQDTIGTIVPNECAETPPGLQLYVGQDGKTSFSGSAIRSKPIIINKR